MIYFLCCFLLNWVRRFMVCAVYWCVIFVVFCVCNMIFILVWLLSILIFFVCILIVFFLICCIVRCWNSFSRAFVVACIDSVRVSNFIWIVLDLCVVDCVCVYCIWCVNCLWNCLWSYWWCVSVLVFLWFLCWI